MHLLTFLSLKKPGFFFRTVVLGAQGIFYNLFFLTYLFSPRVAHRFVGFLEEEAVVTYTRCIEEIEQGRLPEWENQKAPEIAISYWRLAPDATLLDTIRAVRADEATHRFVNHSFASLNPKSDYNPFSLAEPPAETRGTVPGFTREESAAFAQEARKKASEGLQTQEKKH
ncbi:alternative oxidase-domain-containing protein [Mrakia frigida]|uniref:alternative oxidase n=1 Tax=Mrakia frigida TaxID=29902 RepID=UPI003FCC0616